MKKVMTENLEDNMILAKPLIGQNGNVLLNEGVELKSSMADRLKRWGIAVIYVVSEESEEEKKEKDEAKNQKSQELVKIFADVIENPIMKIIFTVSSKHISEGDGN